MAILKHFNIHNRNYQAAVIYFMYQHDQHAHPIHNEKGHMIVRENLLIEGINTDIFSYGFNCKHTSMKYGKNLSKKEIKSYHWVISFDPKDISEHGLTVEKAQELGMKFARAHFGGFECIVATHEDGSSGSGNIHVHIAHNSVRCKDVEQPAYSQLERDRKAGSVNPARNLPSARYVPATSPEKTCHLAGVSCHSVSNSSIMLLAHR